MKRSEYPEVLLNQLHDHFPAITSGEMSNDFFISEFCKGSELNVLEHPFRFDGYFGYFCLKGKFEVEVNMRKFVISEGTLLLYVPGNIVNLDNLKDFAESEFVFVAVSRNYIQNVKVNMPSLVDEAMLVMSNPCICMGRDDLQICGKYYRLAEQLIKSSHKNLDQSMMGLGSSLFHYLGSLWSEHITEDLGLSHKTMRSKSVYEKFMRLVAEYHMSEREVGFYADKLHITPKYLSQLVRKVSGQSAPDWIANFVILEAKNYLKYSDLDIKAIAYKLNFSSTPSFFRYFKAHTGLTPQQFRKS